MKLSQVLVMLVIYVCVSTKIYLKKSKKMKVIQVLVMLVRCTCGLDKQKGTTRPPPLFLFCLFFCQFVFAKKK